MGTVAATEGRRMLQSEAERRTIVKQKKHWELREQQTVLSTVQASACTEQPLNIGHNRWVLEVCLLGV